MKQACIKVNTYTDEQITNSNRPLKDSFVRRNKIASVRLQLMLLALFTGMSSCVTSQSFMPIRGTGSLVDKTINVSGFHAIDVSNGFDVILVQGSSEGLTLTAQENLFEHITTKVEQGVLKIYTDRNIIESKGLKAKIAFKSIDDLKVSGGGDVVSETTLDVPNLNISMTGGGDINARINTGDLKCRVSGGGDVAIDGTFKGYDMNLTGGGDLKSAISAAHILCEVSGGGDVSVNSRDKSADATVSMTGGGDLQMEVNADNLKCSISGGGDATFTGTASSFDITINGGGDVKARDLATVKTMFHANGGSAMHLNASKELTGYISGGGDLYYTGNPGVVNIDAKGGSEVHRE